MGGRYIFIYFKELTHMIVGTGKPEICRPGCQAGNGNSGRVSMFQS